MFAIVVESSTRLVKKVVDQEAFQGFKAMDDIKYDNLQFIHDTILVGEGS